MTYFVPFKVSPNPEPVGMETGQLTGESAEGGGTSIAEELLRAIMENPKSTPDKVAISSTFYHRKFLVLNLVLCLL